MVRPTRRCTRTSVHIAIVIRRTNTIKQTKTSHLKRTTRVTFKLSVLPDTSCFTVYYFLYYATTPYINNSATASKKRSSWLHIKTAHCVDTLANTTQQLKLTHWPCSVSRPLATIEGLRALCRLLNIGLQKHVVSLWSWSHHSRNGQGMLLSF